MIPSLPSLPSDLSPQSDLSDLLDLSDQLLLSFRWDLLDLSDPSPRLDLLGLLLRHFPELRLSLSVRGESQNQKSHCSHHRCS